jgi:hypothetical protein
VKAGQEIILHKAISSCVHRNKAYSTKVIDLAERLKYELMPIEKMTRKLARAQVTKAVIHKRGVKKTDGEHRMQWLEELATARAELKDGGDPQRELQKMISSTKQRIIQSRLTAIFKPDWSTLGYIEYPNEKWYITEKGDELYEFHNGIFIAHSMVDENVFHKAGVVKVYFPKLHKQSKY